ncbi:TPA: glycosyl transferase, partial [Candidatus Uhrbacteria bacterium]|nr:glycosyl transferase [Candidatus Uhrbacteria bacterium]
GVRRVVADKQTGLLVPPKDVGALATAIVWMLDHKAEREEMGRRARERVEQFFTWERHASQLEEDYREIQTTKRA